MTNLPKAPGEAYEAGLREGDRRTVERLKKKASKLKAGARSLLIDRKPQAAEINQFRLCSYQDYCAAFEDLFAPEDSQ